MSDFLVTSELTESKAFIRSFVKEIKVRPGNATIRYILPTPEDSPISGGEAQEAALRSPVLSTVRYVVPPGRLELPSLAPEASTLSPELRGHTLKL